MKYTLVFLLLPCLAFTQKRFDFGRYTKVWVVDTDAREYVYTETTRLTGDESFTAFAETGLSFYIPDSNRVTMPNENRYILGYLVNYAKDTAWIDRSDATIYPAETQILVDKEWKTFQVSMGSACGNSDFKTGLPPRSYYTLHIERPAEGSIPVLFRVKFRLGDKACYSNPCTIRLTENEIRKAGQYIEPFSL